MLLSISIQSSKLKYLSHFVMPAATVASLCSKQGDAKPPIALGLRAEIAKLEKHRRRLKMTFPHPKPKSLVWKLPVLSSSWIQLLLSLLHCVEVGLWAVCCLLALHSLRQCFVNC